MFPGAFFKPIPPEPDYDWENIPSPAECGEGLLDPTTLSSQIAYRGSYRLQGLPGALERPLLRETVARKLAQAADILPKDWSLLLFDALRPLSVQRALYDQFRAAVVRQRPELSPRELDEVLTWAPALTISPLWPTPAPWRAAARPGWKQPGTTAVSSIISWPLWGW